MIKRLWVIGTGTGIRLAKAGFAVYGMDYEGHGKSSGLQGFIPCFDDLVNDCSHHFSSVCEREENVKKMRIIMGESMGGAVVLLLHRKKPDYWDGAVLVAPMCKIADDMKPNQMVITVLAKLSGVVPTWKLIPTQDIINIRSNPYCYKGRPRLQTGNELLAVSLDLENRLQEVSLPFIIAHGGDDKVTDPSVSKLLYETASSTDKTFKLYPGMWHSLTYGELPENTDTVFSDIIGWLNDKVALGNSRLEREQKNQNDDLLKANSSEESN
ncbi:hypothetical protein F0562_026096 [Nyssa sinensis]|uniref:Serine aminopeptidase S33 domain-containing protein n=1 Tax=Nyssa sinensis TaxID=561372 RepID=A0A5J5B9T7_9ASTE|nr:hypothetical protein F0562_026096 [Nyssa sinensis]